MKLNIKEIMGFTLIELLIAVAIVGILAAVAYPSYTASLQKTRRVDAISTLMNIQMAQEKYRANHTSYADDFQDLYQDAAGSRTSFTTSDGYYTITLVNGLAASFSATAAPAGVQVGDSCGTFTINQRGPVTASDAERACWNQ